MRKKSKKGVIFGGGTGSRLRPLTLITNKHLLPIFDKPMITYPLETLKSIGITDICIVTGENHVAEFERFLANGKDYGVSISYRTQEGPRGIPDALLKSEDFFDGDKAVGMCGDMICGNVNVPRGAFDNDLAYVYLIDRVQSWGAVPEFGSNGNIVDIVEKPKVPKSDFLVTGLYIYPNDVFDHIRRLKPSQRGELEITDLNKLYLKEGRLKAIKMDSYIADAGTFETLLKASIVRARELGYKASYNGKL